MLNEEQKKAQVEKNDALLFKIVPNDSDPKSFCIENCSATGIYEESIDKLWLVTKTLKTDGIAEVY